MVFGINSSHIVNRKEIVLSFASHYFTPSYLQCLQYLSQIPQSAIILHTNTVAYIEIIWITILTAVRLLTSAPNLTSDSTTSIWPLKAAQCKAVHFSYCSEYKTMHTYKSHTIFTAYYYSTAFTLYIAHTHTHQFTSKVALTSAPDLISNSTTSTWPHWAAKCKDVQFFYVHSDIISHGYLHEI